MERGMIEKVKSEIQLRKEELSIKRRIFAAEAEKELEMLMMFDKWLAFIEKEKLEETK